MKHPCPCVGAIVVSSVFAMFTLAGCGGGDDMEEGRATATGQVRFDGQPLRGGSVTFVLASDSKWRTTAMIRDDGTFRVADVPVGLVNISVETETLKFGAPADVYVPIPAKYADVATSDLSATISENSEPLVIDLQP